MSSQAILNRMMAKINKLEQRVEELESDHYAPGDIDAYSAAISVPLSVAGLVGFWPGVLNIGATNWLRDISGAGHHARSNSQPVLVQLPVHNLATSIRFDGTDDGLIVSGASTNSIVGTEAELAGSTNGVTCVAWVYFDQTSTSRGVNESLIAHWNTGAGNAGWQLHRDYASGVDEGDLKFIVSTDGSTIDSEIKNSSFRDESGTWRMMAGVYKPSTYIRAYIDTTYAEETSSIPASIYSSGAAISMGRRPDDTQHLDGYLAFPWIAAQAVEQDVLIGYYHATRMLFQTTIP